VKRGAVDCVIRERIDHRRLANSLRDAVQRRRQELALWRTGSQAEQLSRFGPVKILGHRFARELAIGGTSMVYLAESERAGDMVVLKVLRDAPETGDQHTQFSRFLQEYELISKIRHPNVVRIFDLGIADDHAYIAMEYFPRGDLRGRIAKRIESTLAVRYLAQMAAALRVVHEVGVLHRDLKPGNIMERTDGSLALIDFGLAKHTEFKADMTGTGEIFGTPYYMSPEQGHGQPLDERSDLYSLGVIFYEMLTGKKPFLAPTPMGVIYLHGNAPRPELSGESSVYQPLLDKLLATEPTERFASAGELLSEIGQLSHAPAGSGAGAA
jgi:serine/threonine protein kinase